MRTANTALRDLLVEARWTEDAMARQVNAVAAEIGLATRLDRRSVSHWLAGRRPRSPLPELIAEAFTRRLGRPLPAHEIGLAAAVAGAAGSAGAERAGGDAEMPGPGRFPADPLETLEALCEPAEGGRETDQGGVYRLAALDELHAWPAGDLFPPPPRTASGARLEPEHVATARRMAKVFTDTDSVFGGGYARVALAHYLAYDVAPRLRAPSRPDTRRRMLRVATELAGLCGFMCFDDERNAIAQRYYEAALGLSVENQDPVGYATVLRAMSVQARTLGHFPQARALAEAAVAGVDGCRLPDARRAAFYGPLAVAAAAVGDRDAALEALAGAQRLSEQRPAEPEDHDRDRYADADADAGPDAFGGCRPGALAYQEAAVRALLGDRPGAIRVLTESVRRHPADQRRSRVITLARLAELHLDQGHLDESIAACHAFIDEYPPLRSSRAHSAMRRLTARLRPHAANHTARQLLVRAASVAGPARQPS